MGGECALYVMAKLGKTPARIEVFAVWRPQANLDGFAICPYTSAVPKGWTVFDLGADRMHADG